MVRPTNTLQGRVVSGHKKALDVLQRKAAAKGALKVTPLAVSGGFHTQLMKPASDKLIKALDEVAIKDPRIPVYSNVTGRPFASGSEIAGASIDAAIRSFSFGLVVLDRLAILSSVLLLLSFQPCLGVSWLSRSSGRTA